MLHSRTLTIARISMLVVLVLAGLFTQQAAANGTGIVIVDRAWHDLDKNGIQFSSVSYSEPDFPGVTVRLYTCEGVLLASTQTNISGNASFDVIPGNYFVEFVAPAGYVFSPQDQGADDSKDSDADPVTGRTICFYVAAGLNKLMDAGFYEETEQEGPGTGTPGYWKNHPAAWPVDSITIGGVTYTKAEAINWLKTNDRRDKTITLFRALVAAKLNVLIGNEASCIAATITAADAWMAAYGPVGSGVKASSAAWKAGEPLYTKLDKYNNGLLCAPHRD